MRVIIALFILFCFSSCNEHFQKKELYGFYSPIDYRNNFDTIQLKPGNLYQRRVYDRNKKLVLEMNGNWLLKDNHTLIIDDFYLNLDDDLIRFPESVKDTDMSLTTFFETNQEKIQFCIGYHEGENCFQKILR